MCDHLSERASELQRKKELFESKSEDKRIEEFVTQNPPEMMRTVEEWMEIHQALTGACTVGGFRFIRAMGFKRYERYSTLFFLDTVDGAYGGDIIKKVKDQYKTGGN